MQTLYDSKVAVANQSNAAQQKAFRESLMQVLIKVSGNNDLNKDANVRKALQDAPDLIRSFRYEITDGIIYMLSSFDEQRVNQLIVDLGFPIWGKRRSDTLVWFVVLTDDKQRVLLSAGKNDSAKVVLEQAAYRRGIPLAFPLMDIQDAEKINVFDVWGRFDDTIKAASTRYPHDNLVAARLFNRNEFLTENESVTAEMSWQLDWQILNSELVEESSLFGSSAEDVIFSFIDLIANRLASRYAVDVVVGEELSENLVIKILNMASIESYVTVRRFLESLALVNSARLQKQSGTVGEFSLDISGRPQDLLNLLQLDQKIKKKTDAFGQTTDDMEFYWLP